MATFDPLNSQVGVAVVVGTNPAKGTAYIMSRANFDYYAERHPDLIDSAKAGDLTFGARYGHEAHILNRGSKGYKDYFSYEFGDVILYVREIIMEWHSDGNGSD